MKNKVYIVWCHTCKADYYDCIIECKDVHKIFLNEEAASNYVKNFKVEDVICEDELCNYLDYYEEERNYRDIDIFGDDNINIKNYRYYYTVEEVEA